MNSTAKAAVFLAFLAFLAGPAAADTDTLNGTAVCAFEGTGVIVRVTNVRSSSGNVKAELYGNDSKTFLKKSGRLVKLRVPAVEGVTEICLPAPVPGTYAVTVYHDENDSKKFDKNFFGYPKEGYGFSNNPGFPLRRPRLGELTFLVGEAPPLVEITLKY